MLTGLERIELVDQIGRELQSRYSYADIELYLNGFGLKNDPPYGGSNSKWLFSKHMLSTANETIIEKIAVELGLREPLEQQEKVISSPKNWAGITTNRCFISHISKDKLKATRLRDCLKIYGINAFVAHEDIRPTMQWIDEIIRALNCMDFFVSMHTQGFSESYWCQQEVGFALKSNVPYIAIKMGEDPVGFQSARQALSRGQNTAEQVAKEISSIFLDQSSFP